MRVAALALAIAAANGPLRGEPPPVSVPGDKATSLFRTYCFDCHADGAHKGDFALDDLLKVGPGTERRGDWRKAWKWVRHEFMPPAGKPAPTPEERQALGDWMAAERLGVDFARPDPGRVTLRRLNRLEYENSVQDLLGASLGTEQEYSSDIGGAGSPLLRLRDRLPPDETAFGFDNIGDFLTLPPTLLEKYFEIAEFVVEHVVVTDGPRSPERSLTTDQFAGSKPAEGMRHLLSAKLEVPRAGTYRVEVHFSVGGWQEYSGSYEFTARLDTAEVMREQLEVGGYKKHRFSASVELTAGTHTLTLLTDAQKPDAKGVLNRLELRPTARVVGPLGAGFFEYPEPHRRVFFRGPAPAEAGARKAYAREILERVATRAFRRPVDGLTLDGLVQMAGGVSSFERGIAQALTAILTSPEFLFRAETQPRPDDPATVHPLDEYALASRLSYLLWLSLPDEELMRLAGQGQLRQNLPMQVKRLLADPKSARFFEDFPGQWLRTRNVLMTAISTKAADKLNRVRASMKRETEMLFEDIARNDRDLIDLITADYTFLDQPLAEYYGLAAVPVPGFHRVSLPAESHRGGLLTQGSFLVATSNPNRTSPVKRGLFVLENLLGLETPPPPPNVPALDDVNLGDTSKKTGRELLALHRADKSCASCHAHFDPIGIALEHYDIVGLWRDTEEGLPIDATETSAAGVRLGSVVDVQRLLSQRKELLYRGITEKFMTYTLGRGLEPADTVVVDRLVRQMATNGGKFSTLLLGLVESPAFQLRRGDAGDGKLAQRDSVPPIPPPEKRRPPKRSGPRPPAPPLSATNTVGNGTSAGSPDVKLNAPPK